MTSLSFIGPGSDPKGFDRLFDAFYTTKPKGWVWAWRSAFDYRISWRAPLGEGSSLHELDGLLAETESKVCVTVVFTIPDGVPAHWEQGELWNSATSIPGLRVIMDQGGGKRTDLTWRVQDMSCCIPLRGSWFSAGGLLHLVDMKAIMRAALP